MKRILLAAAALVFTVAMNAQTQQTTNVQPQQTPDDVMKLNQEKHDFGKIPQGIPAEFYFQITNKSDKAIVVESAQASCGCTTPEKPTEPIAPGATAKLKVQYNAANMGGFTKTVSIKIAGIDQPKVVTIVGEVLAKEAYDEYVKANPVKAEPVKAEPAKDDKTKTKTDKTKTKSKSGK
jgi:hypothetical protein